MLTRGNPSQRMMQKTAVDEESIWDGSSCFITPLFDLQCVYLCAC